MQLCTLSHVASLSHFWVQKVIHFPFCTLQTSSLPAFSLRLLFCSGHCKNTLGTLYSMGVIQKAHTVMTFTQYIALILLVHLHNGVYTTQQTLTPLEVVVVITAQTHTTNTRKAGYSSTQWDKCDVLVH